METKYKTIDDVISDLEVVGDNQCLPDQESYDIIWGAVEFLRGYKTSNFQKQYDDEHDKFLRLAADFQNFKNRMNRDRADMINNAAKDIVTDLIEIADDFDRCINSMSESKDKDGVIMIRQKISKLLDDEGCVKIEVNKGDDFDASLMEAVSTIVPEQLTPNDHLENDTVYSVVKTGYMLNGKILRHPQVVVYEEVY